MDGQNFADIEAYGVERWFEGVILVTHNGRRVDHAGFVDSSPKLSAGRYTLRRGLCRHGRVPLSESSV